MKYFTKTCANNGTDYTPYFFTQANTFFSGGLSCHIDNFCLRRLERGAFFFFLRPLFLQTFCRGRSATEASPPTRSSASFFVVAVVTFLVDGFRLHAPHHHYALFQPERQRLPFPPNHPVLSLFIDVDRDDEISSARFRGCFLARQSVVDPLGSRRFTHHGQRPQHPHRALVRGVLPSIPHSALASRSGVVESHYYFSETVPKRQKMKWGERNADCLVLR